MFKKAYSFVDNYQKDEIAAMEKRMKKTKDPQEKEDIKSELERIKARERAKQEKERKAKIKREYLKAEAEAVKNGKTPYYLKKTDLRRLELLDKFSKMKEGDIDKAIESHRRKKAQKAHVKIPLPRTGI